MADFRKWFGGIGCLAAALLLLLLDMPVDAAESDAPDAEVSNESQLLGEGDDAAGHGEASHGEASHGGDSHGDAAHGETANEGGHAAGSTNPITLDPDLPIVTAIIFLLLLAVLSKFAWGPLVKALDQRETTLAEQLAEAKANQEKSQQLLAEHEAKMAHAAADVKQMLDDARKDADVQKQQIVESAQAAAAAEKDRAVREIEAAKNSALQEMAERSVDTAVGLAGKIVQRNLSHEDHSNLIGEAMQRFNEN